MQEPYYELSEGERTQILDILRQALTSHEEILFAYVHGSFLLNIPFHDIDIGIYLSEECVSTVDTLDYEIDLSMQLSSQIKLPVEVRVLNKAPLGFQFNATSGQLLLSRDDERQLQFVKRVRREYWDFEPMARQFLREVLK